MKSIQRNFIMTSITRVQSKNGKMRFQYDIKLHEGIVRTYIGQQQMNKMTSKYNKKIKLTLLPPESDSCCGKPEEGECTHCTSPKFWTLRASGRHRAVIRNMADDMNERHDNIVTVISNIQRGNAARKTTD